MRKFLQRFTLRSIVIGVVLGLLITGSSYSYLYYKNEQAIKFAEMYG